MPKQPAKEGKKQTPSNNEAIYLLSILGIVALLLLTSLNLGRYLEKQQILGSTTVISTSNNEIAFWEIFLYENNNYIEGWFELAKLKIEIGDTTGAKYALVEIERINPNSEELVKLKKSL